MSDLDAKIRALKVALWSRNEFIMHMNANLNLYGFKEWAAEAIQNPMEPILFYAGRAKRDGERRAAGYCPTCGTGEGEFEKAPALSQCKCPMWQQEGRALALE